MELNHTKNLCSPFKSLKFLTDDLKQSVREELSQLKDADCGNPNFQCVPVKEKEATESPPAKIKEKTALYILLGQGDDDDLDGSENATEVEEFLLEKSLPHNSDVMAW